MPFVPARSTGLLQVLQLHLQAVMTPSPAATLATGAEPAGVAAVSAVALEALV